MQQIRQAVRAIILDPQNRVLLFKAFHDATRSGYFWVTPGGGISDGESDVDALRRELAEECGIAATEVRGPIWVREHTFPMPHDGRLLQQRERFYLVKVDSAAIDITGWDDFERAFTGEHRWWTLEEIRASRDDFAPRQLGRYLESIIADRVPKTAVDVGP